MALDRTFIELTVKTVGEKAVSDLSKELSLTRNEAKKAIQELFGFKKAQDTVEDFNDAVLDTESGIKRYVRFLERQRAEVKFLGPEYQALTASIQKYSRAVKDAQAQVLAKPLSAADLRTEEGIQQHIQDLQRQKSTADMTGEAYQRLKAEIRQYQQMLKEANAEPAPQRQPINPRTLEGLRQGVAELEALRQKVDSSGELFQQFNRQIAISQQEISKLSRIPLLPTVEPGERAKTEEQIQGQIAYLRQERAQVELNGKEYRRLTAEIKQYQQQLQEAQNPQKFFSGSTPRGLRELIAAERQVLDEMDFRDPSFSAQQRKVAEYDDLLRRRTKTPVLPVSPEELDTYGGKLRQIQYLQSQLDDARFDNGSYAQLAKEINNLETQLKEAREAALNPRPVIERAPLGSERWIQEEIKRLSDLRSNMKLTSTEYQAFSRDISKLQEQLDVARNGEQPGAIRSRLLGAAGALGATSLFGGGIVSGLGAGAGYLAGGQAGAFAAAGVAQSLQMTVVPATELAAQVSRLNRVLSEESGAQYADNIEFIRKIAISTGQTLPEATQSFLKLNASIKAAGGDGATARGVYEAIAGAVVKFGGSSQEVNGALVATTQIFSKGKVQAEELSGQIGERLVGAYAKFAKANGYTTKELSKFLEEGEVTLDQFLKFAEYIQKDGVKALEEYGTSAEGAGARFNAAFSQFQVQIGNALLPAGAALQDFGVKLLEVSGNAIVGLVNAGKQVFAAFQAIPKPISDAAVALVGFLAAWKLFSATVAAIQGLKIVAWFGELATAIATTGGILPAAKAAFDAFWISVTGPVGATAAVVAGLAAIGVALYQNNQDFKDWVDAVGQVIYGDWKRGMDAMRDFFSGAVKWVGDGLSSLGSSIANAFGGIGKTIGSKLGEVTQSLVGWYNNLPMWAKVGLGMSLGGATGGVSAIVAPSLAGLGGRVQQQVQANRVTRLTQAAAIGGLTGAGTLGGLFPLGTPTAFKPPSGNKIDTTLPGQQPGKDDDGKKEKAKRNQGLQDYYNKLLRLQKEAFDNQMAYDRQIFENRLRRQKEEFESRAELAKLQEEARISGLTGLGRTVAEFFQTLNEQRRKNEIELFGLRQTLDEKLFQAEQKRLQDQFDKKQDAVRDQAKILASPGGTGAPGSFDTFTTMARSLGLVVTSAFRRGDPGYHGTGQARDYSGSPAAMLQLAKQLASQFGTQLKELIFTPLGFGIKNGRQVPLSFWGDAVNRNHYDHVHVAFTGAPAARSAAPAGRQQNVPRISVPRNVGDDAAARAEAAGIREEISRRENFQNRAAGLRFDAAFNPLKTAIKDSQTTLDDAAKSARDQLTAAQDYFVLLEQGITPELKSQFDAIEETAKKEREQLEFARDQLSLGLQNTELSTEQKKQLQEQLDTVNARLKAQRGITDETKKTIAATKALEERNQRIQELSSGIANSVGSTLTRAFDLVIEGTEDWGRSLQEIASGVLRDIANQILQIMVIRPITNVLSNALPGFLGGLFANGGIMTPDGPMPLRAYSRGGIADRPQLALFGEGRMPEAYVPLPDGRNIPVVIKGGGMSGSQGGNTSVVVNVDASGTSVQGNEPNGQALGKVISQAVQTEILRQKRPGGLLFAGA